MLDLPRRLLHHSYHHQHWHRSPALCKCEASQMMKFLNGDLLFWVVIAVLTLRILCYSRVESPNGESSGLGE